MRSMVTTRPVRRSLAWLAVCCAILVSGAPVSGFSLLVHRAPVSRQPAACDSATRLPQASGSPFLSAGNQRTKMGLLLQAQGDSTVGTADFNREPGESEIKTLLTQRALQNLIFLLDLERDQITGDWLEAWHGHEGIRHYHGLSGLHMGGRAFITKLLRAPNEEKTVEISRRGRGGTGGSPERAAALGSGGNPYLQDHVFEFKTKIEPRRLGDRLIRLRADIADEWIEDLQLLSKENEEMWRSFFETVREDEDKLKQVQMPVWAHDPSDAPSGTSFRGGNYDLLRRLATFKAIQQLSKEWRRAGGREEEVKADYLDRMLTVHGTNFQGDGPYHIDQAFFEVLLSSAPAMVRKGGAGTGGGEEGMVLLSPLSIVEAICDLRVCIAAGWVQELASVRDDHMDIQRQLLSSMYDQ